MNKIKTLRSFFVIILLCIATFLGTVDSVAKINPELLPTNYKEDENKTHYFKYRDLISIGNGFAGRFINRCILENKHIVAYPTAQKEKNITSNSEIKKVMNDLISLVKSDIIEEYGIDNLSLKSDNENILSINYTNGKYIGTLGKYGVCHLQLFNKEDNELLSEIQFFNSHFKTGRTKQYDNVGGDGYYNKEANLYIRKNGKNIEWKWKINNFDYTGFKFVSWTAPRYNPWGMETDNGTEALLFCDSHLFNNSPFFKKKFKGNQLLIKQSVYAYMKPESGEEMERMHYGVGSFYKIIYKFFYEPKANNRDKREQSCVRVTKKTFKKMKSKKWYKYTNKMFFFPKLN